MKRKELSLVELFQLVWDKKKYFILTTSYFILFGLFVAIFAPKQYTSECVIIPESSNSSYGNISNLAALAGINLNTSSGSIVTPFMYTQIFQNINFQKDLMNSLVKIEKQQEPITLYQYLSDKENKYQSFNIVSTLKKYTIGLPFLVIKAINSNDNLSKTLAKTKTTIPYVSKGEQEVIEKLEQLIEISINDKAGYITINGSMPEPYLAAQVTQLTVELLEKYITEIKIAKAIDEYNFIDQNYIVAKKEFEIIQNRLARFIDSNRNVTTAFAKIEEERIRAEYNISFSVYNELTKQREAAKIAIKEDTPILTAIKPVAVPSEKSKPKRAFILIGFAFLGFSYSFLRTYIKYCWTPYSKSTPIRSN